MSDKHRIFDGRIYIEVPDGLNASDAVVVPAALMQAFREWAEGRELLDGALDSRDPSGCDYAHAQIANAEREIRSIFDQLKGPEDAE